MKIQENSFVSLTYKLANASGEVVDKTDDETPLQFVFGVGQILPGLEKSIAGMTIGETKTIVLEADDAYGPRREDAVQQIPRAQFPKEMSIETGMRFQTRGPHGPMMFQVSEIKDDVIVADFNHPLAGQQITFDVEVKDVKQLTQEEIDAMSCGHSCGGGDDDHECCGSCSC